MLYNELLLQYKKDSKNLGLKESAAWNYCMAQMVKFYIKRLSEYEDYRIFLTPNMADPGELINFIEKDGMSPQLVMPMFENTVLPIHFMKSEIDHTDAFSIGYTPNSPIRDHDALILWGLRGIDLAHGIIQPYAMTMKTVRKAVESFAHNNDFRLFYVDNMFALPALLLDEDQPKVDIAKTEDSLRREAHMNPTLGKWVYVPGIYK
jgi:hypothetical protein